MSGILKLIACETSNCDSHASGQKVAVKLNVAGKAYYRCDFCGRKVDFDTVTNSRKFLQNLGIGLPESEAGKPSESPKIPAPKPPAQTPPIEGKKDGESPQIPAKPARSWL